MQLNLSNRFSFWEESESEDKDKCDVKSDELACFTKIVRKQRRAPDCQNKKQRCMIKKDVKDGELFNRVSAFQSLTEEDVDDIINRHNPIKIGGGRIKCNRCNFKTRCSSNLAKCKANGKKCSNCFKSNHFAKSKNCQKTRKEKFKANMNEQNQKESCQTLRYFLKSHNFHLKHGKIPYDDLKLKSPCHHVNKDTGDENSVGCDSRQIMICIKILEEKIELKNKVSNLCYGSTAFLLFYLLVNMDSFLLQKAFDLQQDHSNQDVLIMQNLVTLNKDKKQIPTEMNNEEILMQKLQTQIYKSEKLVKKYTHKLVGIKRNGKGVDNLNVVQEHMFPQHDGINDITFSSSDEEETNMDCLPSQKLFAQVDGHKDSREESFCGLTVHELHSELMSQGINISYSNKIKLLSSCNENKCPNTTMVNKACSIAQLDEVGNLSFSIESQIAREESNPLVSPSILQLDGSQEVLQNDINSAPFSCESEMLSAVINVFRSFNKLWESSTDHELCTQATSKSGLRCLFCSFRSFALRLSKAKTKHFLKPMEILSQIDQLPDENLFENRFSRYLSEIINNVSTYNTKLSCVLFGKDESCASCSSKVDFCNENVLSLKAENTSNAQLTNLETLLEKWLIKKRNEHKISLGCTQLMPKSMISDDCQYIMISLDSSKNIEIRNSLNMFGRLYELVCFVARNDRNSLVTYMKDLEEYNSLECNSIPQKVKMSISDTDQWLFLVFAFSTKNNIQCSSGQPNLTFSKQSLKAMQLRYQKLSNPAKFEKRLSDQRLADAERRKTKSRLEYNRGIDEKRRKTEERLEYNRGIDEERGKNEKRLEYKRGLDEERRKTEERLEYNRGIDEERGKDEKRLEYKRGLDEERRTTEERLEYNRKKDEERSKKEERLEQQRKYDEKRSQTDERKFQMKGVKTKAFLQSIEKDTGFNVICVCCAEYKSRNQCTGIQVLKETQQEIYLPRDMEGLVSKDRKKYICQQCRSKIDEGKKPKKSEKEWLATSHFPTFLKNHLEKVTNYVAIRNKKTKSKAFPKEYDANKVLQLNKLESHILKLVLPFIRVAHCTRGSYIKVKGSLILISADLSHSMTKILPQDQNLLPVCLKRRLEYTGNYIEEIINRDKVKAYFNFFKRFNPLFSNIELREDAIDEYETNCDAVADTFEKASTEAKIIADKRLNETEEKNDDESDSDSFGNEFDQNLNTYFNPLEENKNEEMSYFRDQTSVFCNKYEEDVSIPTVANRLANIIVEAETHYNIEFIDEINKEEIEESSECTGSENYVNQYANLDSYVNDEVFKEAEFFKDILETDVRSNGEKAKIQVKNTLDKVSKIQVAPGESGKFQNWGEDVFIEEKAFPELFPFGVGGYLSSLINHKEDDMGFAVYVRHRILSVDPKFRMNCTYLFFLLLVKELIHLKRCKQTYLRQATKLPNLTKENITNVKFENLSRYNRSYEVFKTMRGTSMYYEEAKKNVMAILRQKGSPSLFVTLSCAEFSWEGLLKEILETIHNKIVPLEDVKLLTQQERNKLISENVVQSTLHFQKRIEKELKLMTMPNFFDNDCEFRVSSYYYRVEFQQRGAPHIHTLLWLEDSNGKSAPTFWTSEDSSEGKEEQLNKLREIEIIATILISASEESVMCDDHHEATKNKRNNDSCIECYSAGINFEECSEHKVKFEDFNNCEDCMYLKKLVRDFQSHKHTFTCQKKNKVINIKKDEGHGRNDGKKEGLPITNYVHCRFNFPQFPLNKTVFILGMSKDLDEETKLMRRNDLKKIKKYLIRQSHSENSTPEDTLEFKYLKSLSFIEFLLEVGMFEREKKIENYSEQEKVNAYNRYLNALSASVRGTGSVFLKRGTKDLFTNNFNRRLLGIHKANHDIQMVVDQVLYI